MNENYNFTDLPADMQAEAIKTIISLCKDPDMELDYIDNFDWEE